jgi:non-canonical poly(A) RNA polymerase PAPD5/7
MLFATANDISRGSHGILRVKSTFSGAYEVLTSRLYIRAEGIARRRSAGGASHKRFDERDGRGEDVSEMSILVGIMGVTAEVSLTRPLALSSSAF